MVITPIGTLIRKIQPQCRCWLMKPPMSGPKARASAPIAAQAPTARVRSRGSVKVATMMASVVGTMSAAPRPCSQPRADQHAAAAGQPRAQRGQREHRQPDHEQPPPAVHVGQPAADQQQPGEHQDVAADHPLQARDRQVQVALDGRDRDVRHVVVEISHEGGQADRHQCPPASGHGPSPLGTTLLYVAPVRRSCTPFPYVVPIRRTCRADRMTCTAYSCQVMATRPAQDTTPAGAPPAVADPAGAATAARPTRSGPGSARPPWSGGPSPWPTPRAWTR